jgi:hypothetical protein
MKMERRWVEVGRGMKGGWLREMVSCTGMGHAYSYAAGGVDGLGLQNPFNMFVVYMKRR